MVTADGTDLRPYEPGMACSTSPTDSWLGAFTSIPGGHFGMLIKPAFRSGGRDRCLLIA